MNFFTTPLIILFLFFIVISTFFIVRQQSAAIVERFGKFQSVRKPGIQIKIPLVDRIAGRLSLKVLQLDVVVETKTSDDVFVKLKVSVQYRVVESKVFDAFYKLDFPQDQITSYVFDLIRSQVPKMKLDDVVGKGNFRRLRFALQLKCQTLLQVQCTNASRVELLYFFEDFLHLIFFDI